MLVTHIMAAAGWLGITVAQLVVAATATVTATEASRAMYATLDAEARLTSGGSSHHGRITRR